MKFLLSMLCLLIFGGLCGGCVKKTYLNISEPRLVSYKKKITEELKKLRKYDVPCRFKIVSPDEFVGKNDTPLTFLNVSHIYYYPLKQLLQEVGENSIYAIFQQPYGEIKNAFCLNIEVFNSELIVSGNKIEYHLYLFATFREPGEKIILTQRIQKRRIGYLLSNYEIPAVVYETVCESMMELANLLAEDQRVELAIKPYLSPTSPLYKEPILIVQRWALLIGVSQYLDNNIPPLQYAHNDVLALAETLTNKGWSKQNIRTLINQQATLAEIKEAINNWLSSAVKESLVLIYFSGHGYAHPHKPSDIYLLPYDAKLDKLASTALPLWSLKPMIENILEAKYVIFVLDACRSGALVDIIYSPIQREKGLKLEKINTINYALSQWGGEFVKAKPGLYVITAGKSYELSYEDTQFMKGIFSEYFNQALQGKADADSDGKISLSEVFKFVDQEVRKFTANRQHPQLIPNEEKIDIYF